MTDEADLPTARITARQRECLQWVRRGYETKEIARELRLAPDTVDMHVKNAMQRLGASNRREAARMAFPEPSPGLHQPPMHQPSAIPEPVESGHSESPDREGDEPDELAERGMLGWPLPRGRARTNELTTAQRLFWILVLAFGAAVAFGVVVNSLESLSRLI